jgi:hypothetical protein
MNWGNKVKRTKRVNVSFEWTNKGDLIAILSDLKEFLASGIETYHNQKKSVEMANKWHEVEFSQNFVDKVHEQSEREINGELKLVIKSNF